MKHEIKGGTFPDMLSLLHREYSIAFLISGQIVWENMPWRPFLQAVSFCDSAVYESSPEPFQTKLEINCQTLLQIDEAKLEATHSEMGYNTADIRSAREKHVSSNRVLVGSHMLQSY